MEKRGKKRLGCLVLLGTPFCGLLVYLSVQHGLLGGVLGFLDSQRILPLVSIALLCIVAVFQALLFFGLRAAGNYRKSDQGFVSDRSRHHQVPGDAAVTFADVAGLEEAKEECQRLLRFMENPERYSRIGASMPRGLIFEGPPGMGKTLLARALANEAAVPFFYLSASELIELFVGVGAARIRSLFEKARANAPCIVFVDELDAVGQKRAPVAGFTSGAEEREQTLNQLLSCLDGLDSVGSVVVVAATNRFEVIDPALIRPGRFDSIVHVELLSLEDRVALVNLATKSMVLSSIVNTADLASRMMAFSGAEIAATCNRAALLAADEGVHEIGGRHFEAAIVYMHRQRTMESSIDNIVHASATSVVFAREKPNIEIEVFPRGGRRCKLVWMSPYAMKIEGEDAEGHTEILIIPRSAISSIRPLS